MLGLKKLYWCLLFFATVGCSSYRQSIMFNVSETTSIKQAAAGVQQAYVLAVFDQVSLKVFTKNGERIIDPDNLLMRSNAGVQQQSQLTEKNEVFQIDQAGIAKLPMLGETKIAGLTLREAELLLQKEFAKFYENVFVTLRCESHRVVVLGAGGGQVVPLPYENVSVAEVLAISKAFMVDAKAQQIRLLRGNDVFVLDFSTVEGYANSRMAVLPGDIVYVEPVRRPFVEGLRDYGQLVSITTSLLAIILVATR